MSTTTPLPSVGTRVVRVDQRGPGTPAVPFGTLGTLTERDERGFPVIVWDGEGIPRTYRNTDERWTVA